MITLWFFASLGSLSLLLIITMETPTMHFEIVALSGTPEDPEAIEVDSSTNGPDIEWELEERYGVPCRLKFFGNHTAPLWPHLREKHGYVSIVRVQA